MLLGIDLSTQQLKAILQNDIFTVHFDADLKYNTTHGALYGPNGSVSSPVAMWLDAFDLLLGRMSEAGVDMAAITAIAGAAQQHGSVYWSNAADAALAAMDPRAPLADLAPRAFALQHAPIWQDASSTVDCAALEAAIGGPQRLADMSGSRAYERFTGPQIARIRRLDPDAYHRTARISLVSSFVASLFLGRIAPIEISDASGMNLMDVLSGKWDDALLLACGGPQLRSKLGPDPVPGGTLLGRISHWWVARWGFNPDCIIAPFTGDNPATVVALSTPGDALLSLGTSTTLLLSIPPADTPPARFTTSHLLAHPTNTRAKIAMLCYKNGALAREYVRDTVANKDWDTFNQLVQSTPPGNHGHLGFYFILPEIIPPNVAGEFFFIHGHPTDTIPSEARPRAILESQFLSIKSRIAAILPPNAPPLNRLILTGGSSANQTIRQIAADIFGMPVHVAESKEAAGTGGAVLAKFAWWKHQRGDSGSFEEMDHGHLDHMQLVAQPNSEVTRVYDQLLDTYRACEQAVVDRCQGN